MKPVHIEPNAGIKLNLLGIPATIRIHGDSTEGAVAVIELRDQPGGGAPMHVHEREDETFHVIEGEYEFTCGDTTFVAKPGSMIFGPRGVAHGYRYLGKTEGRVVLFVSPAGIEKWFEEVGALKEQTPAAVMDLGRKYGLQFLPPA